MSQRERLRSMTAVSLAQARFLTDSWYHGCFVRGRHPRAACCCAGVHDQASPHHGRGAASHLRHRSRGSHHTERREPSSGAGCVREKNTQKSPNFSATSPFPKKSRFPNAPRNALFMGSPEPKETQPFTPSKNDGETSQSNDQGSKTPSFHKFSFQKEYNSVERQRNIDSERALSRHK